MDVYLFEWRTWLSRLFEFGRINLELFQPIFEIMVLIFKLLDLINQSLYKKLPVKNK